YALALERHRGDDIPFAYYDIYQPGAEPLLPPVPLALERLRGWAHDKGYEVRVDDDVVVWYRRHLRTLQDAAARGLAVDVSNVYSSDGYGLYGYQQEGVQAILGNAAWDSDGRARILVADDPRLGKSPQALTALRLLGLDGPVLILCPKSLLDQWTEYVHAWLPEATPVTLEGTASQRQAQLRDALREHARPAIITNWETALMDRRDMFVTYWWAVIGDEAHRLKNRNSKITKAVGRLACHHLLLLSATFTERTSADWYA